MPQHCVFSSPWRATRLGDVRPRTHCCQETPSPTPFSHVPATSTRDAALIQPEYPMAQMKYFGETMTISFDGHQVLTSYVRYAD